MAGRLLFVILMYFFAEIQAQALLPPKLTVNPAVITETDSVILNCQTPSSVSVSQCYFRTDRGGPAKGFSCLKTLTGTELLKMTKQSSPAEVKVTCFYLHVSPSPDSDMSSITIHNIMERESRMPPTMPTFSMSTGQKPEITFQHFYGDRVFFTCSLPGSANRDTRCNLYLGEATRPVLTTNTERKKTSTNQRFCQFTVIINDLLRRLHLGQQSDASCDYSLGSEPNSLSPRSDRYKLTEIVERESYMTPTMPTFSMTTGLTVNNPGASTPVTLVKTTSTGQTIGTPSDTGASISTFLTSVKPEAVTGITSSAAGSLTSADTTSINPTCGDEITGKLTLMTRAGVSVGVVLLGLALLFTKSRTDNCVFNRPKAKVAGLPHGYDETYSIILYECNTEKCSSKRQKTNVTGLPDGYDETYSIVTYECDTVMTAAPQRSLIHQP
ncbi:uncharacterized protein LOC117256946 isoform X4 [Epinephelus lanceolatus]